MISLEVCDVEDDDDNVTRDVYLVQGNYVIDLSSILQEVAVCRSC